VREVGGGALVIMICLRLVPGAMDDGVGQTRLATVLAILAEWNGDPSTNEMAIDCIAR